MVQDRGQRTYSGPLAPLPRGWIWRLRQGCRCPDDSPSRIPPPSGASSRAAPRHLTFLAGVTRVIAIVACDPQNPVLDGGHPVGSRLDIHRERGAAAPGAAGRRAQRGARALVQVPPTVLMLQLVLPRPGSDSTVRRSTGSASQQRRRRSSPHSGRPVCQPGSSPARHPALCCPNSAPSPRTPTAARAGVGAPPGRQLSSLTLLRLFSKE